MRQYKPSGRREPPPPAERLVSLSSRSPLPALPRGTITFLFTDIGRSVELWERDQEAMGAAVSRHDGILSQAIAAHGGYIFERPGDAFCAAFESATRGVAAALEAQLALLREDWAASGDLRVRMVLHTGPAQSREGNYYGPSLNRCGRLLAIAHPGQVLLSQATAELVWDEMPAEAAFRDLGSLSLRDLVRPQHVLQLVHPGLPADFPPLQGLACTPNNLPVQATSFIGRAVELQALKDALAETRVVTLTGPGGVGKTRLALQAGADLLAEFPDGVWLVELDQISDPDLVPQAVCRALGLTEGPGRLAVQALCEHLQTRCLLLVVDNCEHLVQSCAQLVETVLRACPSAKILATSREALDTAGEVRLAVPSLAVPDPADCAGAGGLPSSYVTKCEAVQLFAERASAVRTGFAVTDANAAAVAQICWRLDGIPLAIELAAAMANVLTEQDIASRLDNRFALLTRGRRTALPRQRTLREAIDWSHQLLSEQEQVLLRRLSVFAGGWTLEGAEAVGGAPPDAAPDAVACPVLEADVLELLFSLARKSLVTTDGESGQMRYGLLETVHEYAAEKLRESGEEALVRQRHGTWFANLAEQASQRLAEEDIWADRMETEGDNLDQAFEWSLTAGEASTAARLAEARNGFWHSAKPFGVFKQWTATALAGAGGAYSSLRTRLLWMAAGAAHLQGDSAEATRLAEESLRLARELGDRKSIAYATMILGHEALRRGDFTEAQGLLGESLSLGHELGDHKCIAYSLNSLGNAHLYQRSYPQARELHEQALAHARERRDWRCTAWAFLDLGYLARCQGDYEQAVRMYDQCLALGRKDKMITAYAFDLRADTARCQGDHALAADLYARGLPLLQAIGDKPGLIRSLEGVAKLACERGDPRRAALLFGAAELLREKARASVPPCEHAEHQRCVSDVRGALGEEAAARAGAEGRALALNDAIAEALRETARRPPGAEK
jgi:predicted ATPase/class 3 adenylate cyclase